MVSRLSGNPFIKCSRPQIYLLNSKYSTTRKLASTIITRAGKTQNLNRNFSLEGQETFRKITCYYCSTYRKKWNSFYLMSIFPLILLIRTSDWNEKQYISCKDLINKGKEVSTKQRIFAEEITLFLEAVIHNDLSVIQYALKNGSSVNQTNNKKQSALHLSNSLEMITYLLMQNANIDAQDEDMNTPLILACKNNNTEKAKLLIKSGADIRLKDHRGLTALFYAQENKNERLVSLLLIKTSDIEDLSDEYVIEKGRKTIEMLKKRLQKM